MLESPTQLFRRLRTSEVILECVAKAKGVGDVLNSSHNC